MSEGPKVYGPMLGASPWPRPDWRDEERQPPTRNDRTAPVLDELAEAFENTPNRGGLGHGEMLPQTKRKPQPPPAKPLEIEPPPWQAELEAGTADIAAAVKPEKPSDGLTAIEEMTAKGEPAYDPEPPAIFLEKPPQPAPKPFLPEKPDWEAEVREHAERKAAEAAKREADERARLIAAGWTPPKEGKP